MKSKMLKEYDKAFEFAQKIWETTNNKKYSGSLKDLLEVECTMNKIADLLYVEREVT